MRDGTKLFLKPAPELIVPRADGADWAREGVMVEVARYDRRRLDDGDVLAYLAPGSGKAPKTERDHAWPPFGDWTRWTPHVAALFASGELVTSEPPPPAEPAKAPASPPPPPPPTEPETGGADTTTTKSRKA